MEQASLIHCMCDVVGDVWDRNIDDVDVKAMGRCLTAQLVKMFRRNSPAVSAAPAHK